MISVNSFFWRFPTVATLGIGFIMFISFRRPHPNYQNRDETYSADYLKQTCSNDKSNLDEIYSLQPSQLSHDRIHRILQKRMLTPCKDIKPFGGKYVDICKIFDGHKYVCVEKLLEDVEKNRCLIYSFGINTDYTFENTVSALGCEVHAYDPTVDLSTRKIPFHFHKVGVSHKSNHRDKTLGELLKENGHLNRHITMVKMDVEGAEREGLDAWLEEGALDNVHQVALEYHLMDNLETERQFISTVQNLNKHQFRTISWEANSCRFLQLVQKSTGKVETKEFFFNVEIVWVRIPNAYNVSEACGY